MGARLWMEAGLWDTGLKRKIMADEKDPDAGWRGREENWQLPVALTFSASLGSTVTFLSRSKPIQLNRVPLAEPPVCCLRLSQKPLWRVETIVLLWPVQVLRHVKRRDQLPWHAHAVQYTVARWNTYGMSKDVFRYRGMSMQYSILWHVEILTACRKTCSDTVACPCCTVYCGMSKKCPEYCDVSMWLVLRRYLSYCFGCCRHNVERRFCCDN